MKMNFQLGTTYKITYSDGHVVIATFKGCNPPNFKVDGELIDANVLLNGYTSCEEIKDDFIDNVFIKK